MSLKAGAVIVLLVLLVIFAIQNTHPVEVKFLLWKISTSAVLSILVSFFIGFLMGWLVSYSKPARKEEKLE